MSAYTSPAVESEERFSTLAILNLVGVTGFAMDRLGWDDCQVEKLLKSVIRALEEKYFFSRGVKLPIKDGLHLQESEGGHRESNCIEISDYESFEIQFWFSSTLVA